MQPAVQALTRLSGLSLSGFFLRFAKELKGFACETLRNCRSRRQRSKEECLFHLILFGERSLRKALTQFQEHYHAERNHQGKNNVLLFPAPARLAPGRRRGMRCRERLGGLLRYYSRAA